MNLDSAITQLAALPIDDRIRLVQAIWDSIAADEPPDGLTDEQRQLFARRIADLDANPENVLTWEQIKARVKGRQ
jgi:putative addiction module component (TIGR02574 family)